MSYVADAFSNLKSALEITQTEQQLASTRRQAIYDHLGDHWDVASVFLTGSYDRHTKTKKLKDVDIFVVVDEPPRWLELVGDAFPLKPFVNSFQDCFNPFVDAPAFNWGNLAFITAWGIAGAAVAVWRFRWEPSTGGSGGRRRRRGAAIDAA